MATITTDVDQLYRGYDGDLAQIGAGILNPGIYATPEYAERKVENLNPSGALATCIYAGFDNDPNPVIMTLKQEFQYNTILAINIRYMNPATRKAMFKIILDSNRARINSQSSLIISYEMLARAMPNVIPYVVRRYKQQLLRVNNSTDKGVVPLVEWPEMIDINSPFENFYQKRGA